MAFLLKLEIGNGWGSWGHDLFVICSGSLRDGALGVWGSTLCKGFGAILGVGAGDCQLLMISQNGDSGKVPHFLN